MRPSGPEASSEAAGSAPVSTASGPRRDGATVGAVLVAAAIGAVGVITAMLLGAVRQVVAARYLGPEGLGIIGLAESIENVMIRVAPLGLTVSVPMLLARAVSRRDQDEAGRLLGSTIALGLALLAIAAGAMLVVGDDVADLLGAPRAAPVLRIWALVILGLGTCQIASAVLRGLLRIPAATWVRDVVPNALLLVGLVVAFGLGLTLPELAYAYAAGAVVAAAVALGWVWLVSKSERLPMRIAPDLVGPLMTMTAPALTMVLAGQLMRQVNIPILTAATDIGTVGFFTAALFLATTTEAVFTSLTLVYMPYANRMMVDHGREALASVQPAIGRWTYLVSMVPIAVLSAFAEPIISILYGEQFLPAAVPLRIVLIGLLIRAVIGPRNSVLLAIDRGRDVSINFAASLAAAIAIAVALTPPLGMVGSALSFAMGFAIRSLLSEFQLRRALPASGMQRREYGAAVTIALFAVAAAAPNTPLSWLGPLMAGILTLAIFVATRDRTDTELLRVIRRKFWAVRGKRAGV